MHVEHSGSGGMVEMVIGDDGEERVVGMVSVQHGGGPTESDAGSSGKDVATSVVSMALLELGSAVRGPNDNGWRGEATDNVVATALSNRSWRALKCLEMS